MELKKIAKIYFQTCLFIVDDSLKCLLAAMEWTDAEQ